MLAALWPTDTSARLHLLTLTAFAGVEAVVFTSLYTTLPNAVRQTSDEAAWLLVWLSLMTLALLRRAASAINTHPKKLRALYLVVYLPVLLQCLLLFGTDLFGIALAALMALVVWWRGLALGQSQLHPPEARQHFWWGLGLVTAFLAFDFKLVRLGLLIALALFGLMALMVSQLNAVARHNDISPRALTRPAWRKALGLVLLAALGLVALDAVLLNSEAAAWLVRGALALIIIPISLIIIKLIQWLIPVSLLEGLGKAVQVMMQRLGELGGATPPTTEAAEAVAENTGPTVDPQLLLFGAVLAIVVVVLLLLAGGMGLRRAAKRRSEVDAMPTVDTSNDDDDANDAEEAAPGRLRNTFSRWFAAATIRLIYARMAREAAKRSFERKPTQTTQEFLPALQQAFPTAEADVRLISDAYDAAHYGQVPDSAEQLALIHEAWGRVRRIPPPASKGESLTSVTTSS